MSELAITGYNAEFDNQLSGAGSEFTEPASIGGVTYYGIFDEHAEMFSKDQGGVMPSQTVPRFWLSVKPTNFVKFMPVIIRDTNYESIKIEPDKNGGYLITLSKK